MDNKAPVLDDSRGKSAGFGGAAYFAIALGAAVFFYFIFKYGLADVGTGARVTYVTALAGGILSFLSPCVLPLVPPYLGFMAGASISELADKGAERQPALRAKVIISALLFVLGFSLVFISLGASATTIGRMIRVYQQELSIAAGLIIIIMGLHFLGLLKIGVLQREARFRSTAGGYGGAFLMGLAFAFGWTPCIGPILGPILGMASAKASIADGASLLAVYSAGLGIPFILAAIYIEPFMRFLARFKNHMGKVEKVMGAMLIIAGIAFITGGMQAFAFWMLETFPGLAKFG